MSEWLTQKASSTPTKEFLKVSSKYIPLSVKYEKPFIKAENISFRRGITAVTSRALALEGGNFNKPTFKSSNTEGVIPRRKRWLKVRIDRAHESLYFS